jgi:hypothetical protein
MTAAPERGVVTHHAGRRRGGIVDGVTHYRNEESHHG